MSTKAAAKLSASDKVAGKPKHILHQGHTIMSILLNLTSNKCQYSLEAAHDEKQLVKQIAI